MAPENQQQNRAECDRCGTGFEAEQLPAECPKCGTTVTRRPAVEATPAELLAERFRLAAQRAKGKI